MGKSGKVAYFMATLGIIFVLLSLGGVITLGSEGNAGYVHPFLSSGPSAGEDKPVPGGAEGKYRIVIDPGHGGKDPGATSASGKEEKDFTLALAQKVYELLRQDPMFEPILTRTSDEFIELEDRSKVANDLNADALISLHGNTYEGPETVSGTETYYNNEGDGSHELAEDIHQHLIEALGFRDRGVRQEDWKVLRTSEVPAVLAEIGFLTNAENESVLLSEAGQDKAAHAIVEALREYFGK
ncbi:MAG: N-acetylmuramoyl-L-alanine amidase [Paenibacillus sp.]|uniref:N-acetylmuramoyl-L-alanine amidase family protein n=1 Tax=Paenibacillus sp. TaxID=58172 RepID=UPI0029101713|nr:N-acetylmuramoyl-L-alanine amidase [Paenibacillus sp.]MDU4695932.1 N-acetylmuramoyl-L-alanine amidase [Paenibacillus sp.]